MNFLAHFYLSGDDEALIVGNFLGDYLKNKEVAVLPPAVQRGVMVHRQIDSFTDLHPMVRQSAARLRAVHGKYAPVLVDVFYDFILAKNWNKYSPVPLPVFTQNIYRILERHIHFAPPYLQKRLPLMIADDWLVRYGTEAGMEFTFSRMKLRSSKPTFFDGAFESLKKDYGLYEGEFNSFFPEAIGFVKKL